MAEHDSNHSILKARVEFEQRYVEDLKRMKKEAKAKGELSNGRRKWFNRERDETREKIQELLEKMREN